MCCTYSFLRFSSKIIVFVCHSYNEMWPNSIAKSKLPYRLDFAIENFPTEVGYDAWNKRTICENFLMSSQPSTTSACSACVIFLGTSQQFNCPTKRKNISAFGDEIIRNNNFINNLFSVIFVCRLVEPQTNCECSAMFFITDIKIR